MACALADHMSLVLGGGGEHVKCQPVCSWHIGNRKIEATAIHQRGNERDAAGEPIELRNQQGSLAPSWPAPWRRPAAAGRCACRFPPRQILRSVRHGGLRDSAARPRAAPRRKIRAIVDNKRQERSLSSMVKL